MLKREIRVRWESKMKAREIFVDAVGTEMSNKKKNLKWLDTECIYKIHSFLNTKNNLAETKMEKEKTGFDYSATEKYKTSKYSVIDKSSSREGDHKIPWKMGKAVLNGKTGRVLGCDV